MIMNKVLEDYYKIRKEHDYALGKLEKETSRIISVIKSIFKIKGAWWSFKYYEDGDDDPPLPEEICKDEKYGDSFPIYISEDADSGVWYYHEAFPVSFFDMTDEDIRNHIQKEIKEFKKKEKEEKEKEKKKREEKSLKIKQLKESAAKKLTKEEKKALGISSKI